MAWQNCTECRGCPASEWHRKKCLDRNEEYEEEQRIEAMIAQHEAEEAMIAEHERDIEMDRQMVYARDEEEQGE